MERFALTFNFSPFCLSLFLSVSVYLYPECTTYLEVLTFLLPVYVSLYILVLLSFFS